MRVVKKDRDLSLALLAAVLGWEQWCFRRVDSVHLFDRDRGRQRHSIDCMPPTEPSLAYFPHERSKRKIARVQGPVILPLALIRKGPMRQFDSNSSTGETLPVLGMAETIPLTIKMLCVGLQITGRRVTPEVKAALAAIVGPDETKRQERTRAFLEKGEWEGEKVLDVEQVPTELMLLIERLVNNFLLVVLLPSRMAGVRQVLKFSFFTSVEINRKMSFRDRLSIAAGISRMECSVAPVMPDAAASYHIEFNAPAQLECAGLYLVAPRASQLSERGAKQRTIEPNSRLRRGHGMRDTTRLSVAHVYGVFDGDELLPHVIAHLEVPMKRSWLAAFVSGVLATTIFLAALLLPGAKEAILDAPEGAAALLLAAPAVLIGYLATSREHELASTALVPLRWVIVMSALSVFAMAASVVGSLRSPFLEALWIGCAITSGAASALMGSRVVLSVVRWIKRELPKQEGNPSD